MRASNSSIQAFKRCPRLYQLRYVYGFIPVFVADALEIGLSYHEAVENMINGQKQFDCTANAKTSAMINAFQKHILPQIQETDNYVPEKWFEYWTPKGNLIVGRYDGIGEHSLLEHKTTSQNIDGNYWAGVQNDEQMLTYMLASGKRRALYTACCKPRIRQMKNETDAEFEDRCMRWYETDTDQKISASEIIHSDWEIKEHERDLDAICDTIQNCKNFYRNRAFCRYFGRVCEYASICNHCNPDSEYIGFTKK